MRTILIQAPMRTILIRDSLGITRRTPTCRNPPRQPLPDSSPYLAFVLPVPDSRSAVPLGFTRLWPSRTLPRSKASLGARSEKEQDTHGALSIALVPTFFVQARCAVVRRVHSEKVRLCGLLQLVEVAVVLFEVRCTIDARLIRSAVVGLLHHACAPFAVVVFRDVLNTWKSASARFWCSSSLMVRA